MISYKLHYSNNEHYLNIVSGVEFWEIVPSKFLVSSFSCFGFALMSVIFSFNDILVHRYLIYVISFGMFIVCKYAQSAIPQHI